MVTSIPLETLYMETYNLGFPYSRVEVLFDFDHLLLLFRPVRRTGDSPINDLPEEELVCMPTTYKERKDEVQRVVRLLKDEVHAACKKRGLAHDFDMHPTWRD